MIRAVRRLVELIAPPALVALAWIALGAAHTQTSLRAVPYASGFSLPVALVQDPLDRTVQFVVEQRGLVRGVRGGAVLSPDFLDLTGLLSTGPEQGLLGLAFAPDYAVSGRLFVNFTDTAGNTVVARFRRSANPLVVDPGSRFDLGWGGAGGPAYIVQPYANHNGGNLVFGPDGFLYVGLGDGGSGGDPDNRAQNSAELLGKMLRVDINVPDGDPIGYRIPPDNPFAGSLGTRPEIWSFGLRNPWRYSFDDPARRGTGALVVGDVGQNMWEEVDYEPPHRGGRNYGWRNREGGHDYDTSRPPAFLPLRDPIFEYDHTVGNAITGGYVYRGCGLGPAYQGRYFFADFGSGRVWSAGLAIDPSTGEAQTTDVVEHTAALGGSGVLGNVSSFGVDAAGELYLVNYLAGTIAKVLDAGNPGAPDDVDCDGKSDRTVFRPSTGGWFTALSGGGATSTSWGAAEDVDVAGDYDGDGRTDVAVWRPSTGTWFIARSSDRSVGLVPWGTGGDIPLAGDVDGDGKDDLVIWRPTNGAWFVNASTAGTMAAGWGTTGDQPLLADWDGDGRTDFTIWRPATGTWHIVKSTGGTTTFQWGAPGDVPVAADFDGDGKADAGIFRPSTGSWFVSLSTGGATVVAWGAAGDIPVVGDQDGDGRADFIVWRPNAGVWFTLFATGGSSEVGWGTAGDRPTGRLPGSQ